jgi:signal transduction histidine kinase
MTQVLWNLARNGLEAMPLGGKLTVELAREESSLVLTVRDEGRGLQGEDHRRLFEPFQSGTRLGTGLGLAIVYRIVRDHNGDISLSSRPGRGTEVRVRIPAVAASLASADTGGGEP